jgi:CRP-like cAMP-binding protein
VRRRTDRAVAEAPDAYMDTTRDRSKKTTPLAGATGAQGNLLLAALSRSERQRLIERCEFVELTFGDVLCEQGKRLRYVYFPTGGFISLISALDDRPSLEVGLIGVEGMLGASMALGVDVAPLRAIVQGAGSALRMDAPQFSRELARTPELSTTIRSYLYVLMSQLAQMAACTRFHLVEPRLARWLLMTRDRARSNEFHLTQNFIAYMLGVRRAGIVRAARALQRRKLIRYSRGNMTILNASGLQAASCSCYAAALEIHARVMQ